MITPGWIAHVESCWLEFGQKVCDNAKCTSSRQGLHRRNSFITNPWAVEAEESALGALIKLGETVNGQVLLVQAMICHNCGFSFAHDREDVWLSIVVAVGTDAQVNLLWVLVILEASGQRKDRVSGCLRHVLKLIVEGGKTLHVDEIFLLNYNSIITKGTIKTEV